MRLFKILNGFIDRLFTPIDNDRAIGIIRNSFLAGGMSSKTYLELKGTINSKT